jgi:hypothetical protein
VLPSKAAESLFRFLGSFLAKGVSMMQTQDQTLVSRHIDGSELSTSVMIEEGATTTVNNRAGKAVRVVAEETVSGMKAGTNVDLSETFAKTTLFRHTPLTPLNHSTPVARSLETSTMIAKALNASHGLAAAPKPVPSYASSSLASFSKRECASVFEGGTKHLLLAKKQLVTGNNLRTFCKVGSKKGHLKEKLFHSLLHDHHSTSTSTTSFGRGHNKLTTLLHKQQSRRRLTKNHQESSYRKTMSSPELSLGYEDPDKVAAMPSRRMLRRVGAPLQRRNSVTKFSFESGSSLALRVAVAAADIRAKQEPTSRIRNESCHNASWFAIANRC